MTSPPPKNLIPTDPLYLIIIYRESTEWDCLQIARCVQPLGLGSAVACNGFNNWVWGLLFYYQCRWDVDPLHTHLLLRWGNGLLLMARAFWTTLTCQEWVSDWRKKRIFKYFVQATDGSIKNPIIKVHFFISTWAERLVWTVSMDDTTPGKTKFM